ncbi:MAG: hypothetical protein ACXWL5_02240 [Candidatus Chromulinivorax sp.]
MKNYKKIVTFVLLITHIAILSNKKDQGTCESLKGYPYVDKNKVLEAYNKFASQYDLKGNYKPNANYIPDSLKTSLELEAFQALKKENKCKNNIDDYKTISSHLFDNEYNWGPGWFNFTSKHSKTNQVKQYGTANWLKHHPYANKNLVIDAYNKKNPNLLSTENDKLAYNDLIKENTRKNCTHQTIASVYEDNEYSINWAKIGTFEFLTRK